MYYGFSQKFKDVVLCLAAHVADPATNKTTNITDAGGNFTATEVEGALAELAAGSTDDPFGRDLRIAAAR